MQEKKEKKPTLSTKEWYLTFMKMGIPVIGFFYLLWVAWRDPSLIKKRFAKAYLLYQITLGIACLVILAIGAWIVIPYIERLLDYIEML